MICDTCVTEFLTAWLSFGCACVRQFSFYSRDHYRDTNGENNYHHTSSFDDDLLLDLDSRGAASARLDRTQDDLTKFKARIDSNVEQQKEYSDMMHALQQKVG